MATERSAVVQVPAAFPRALPRLRAALAFSALLGLLATGLAFVVTASSTSGSYALFKGNRSVPRWMVGPFDVPAHTMSSVRYILLLSAMWVCYLVVVALADAIAVRWAVVAIAILTILFTVAPPMLSTDIFNYVDYARLGVLHHLNPYEHGPIAAPGDPAFLFTGWDRTPTIYGPLFTLLTYALVPLGLPAAVWSLKALMGLASLGCVALVWRCAREIHCPPVPAILLFGLNPMLLVFAVGGGHNDMLALLLFMAAVTLLVRRPALSGGALVAAIAIKATSVVIVPFMALGARRHWRFVAGAAAAGAVTTVVGFAFFGASMFEVVRLILRHGDVLYGGTSVPAHVAPLLGLNPHARPLRTAASVLALLIVVALVLRTAKRGNWIANAGWATVSLLCLTTWLPPWYTVWALPFAALGRERLLVFATLALGTFVVVSRMYLLPL